MHGSATGAECAAANEHPAAVPAGSHGADVPVLQVNRTGIDPDGSTGLADGADSADDAPAGQGQAGGINADIAPVSGQRRAATAKTHIPPDNRQARPGACRTGLAKRCADDLHIATSPGDEANRLGSRQRVGGRLQVQFGSSVKLHGVAREQRQRTDLAELRVGANDEPAWVHQDQIGRLGPEMNGAVEHRRFAAGHPRDHAPGIVAEIRERQLLAVEQRQRGQAEELVFALGQAERPIERHGPANRRRVPP